MNLNEVKLIEKIVRAKVKLEGARAQHTSACPVDADPEGHAPCTCGASTRNSAIKAVLKELSFEG